MTNKVKLLAKLNLRSVCFFLIIFQSINFNAACQAVNWSSISDTTKHIVTATVGLDQATSYGFHYGYKLSKPFPIILTTGISIPFGERPLDDLEARVGGEMLVLNRQSLKASVSLQGIYGRFENSLVRVHNLGGQAKGVVGYYRQKWFVAAEFTVKKVMANHFTHSNKYRNDIYADVVDGWYQPATTGHFSIGIQTGLSFKKLDLTLQIGQLIMLEPDALPLVPVYLNVGVNYRI